MNTILIAEDNPVSAITLESNLQKHGYQTVVVSSGKQALEHLETGTEVQLIITDLSMPEMGGLELLDNLRKKPEWSTIPVIVSTSMADLETVEQAIELGCADYIVKPIKATHLLTKIREVMGLIERNAREHSPAITGALILRDSAQVITELGLNPKSYKDIASAFAALVNEKIRLLEGEVKDGDAASPSMNITDLREGAILMGAERLLGFLQTYGVNTDDVQHEVFQPNYKIFLRELQLLQPNLKSFVNG